MQQPQPASGPAAQPQQSQQPQQFQQPASHTQQWAPVIEAHDLVMDYTASMARAQAGHGVTGVMPAGTGAGYASANPAAAGPGAIQAGQPSQPAQPGFAMPTMHTLALNHVNFTLREGETVAVMGPSGSGKSTLLHALAGIIKPTAGTVIFRGADLSRMSDAERTKLRRNDFGFVFQSGQLLPELPAVENIALPMMLDGMPYRTATDTAILWLERMGLRALATHRPGEMSGGQMQRIAIARALAVKPAVVFADEPTGALDQATGREVMGILMAAARDNGSAVVVVTHDPNVASFCGRTVMMQDGRLHQTDANPNSAPAGGGCPADAGLGVVSVSHGLRSWDIAHPRLWGTAINENRVPWADSETITPEENLEELIMLGLRLHEGLDLDRINRAINDAGMSSTPQTLRTVSVDQLAPMISEGLITVSDNHRVVPTRRGRLLNDAVIEQFFDFVGV